MNASATSISVRHISLEAAQKAVASAVAHAQQWGIRVNVAVCDGSGVLLAFARMPGAFLHSIDIAIDKAYTSASFGIPTAAFMGIIENDPALLTGLPQRTRLVVFGGGLPIREDGALIGGIGVSGGSAEQDEDCARAGLQSIGLA